MSFNTQCITDDHDELRFRLLTKERDLKAMAVEKASLKVKLQQAQAELDRERQSSRDSKTSSRLKQLLENDCLHSSLNLPVRSRDERSSSSATVANRSRNSSYVLPMQTEAMEQQLHKVVGELEDMKRHHTCVVQAKDSTISGMERLIEVLQAAMAQHEDSWTDHKR